MFFDAKCGRLESLHVVAGGTLAFVGTLDELSIVLIFVAVETALKGERFLEIAAAVATQAIHCLVLAFQGIFGFGMIETLADRLQRNSFPARGVVAGLASLLREAAAMGIGVAIRAGIERQTNIARLVVGSRRMALRAGHLRVEAGQRITSLVMVKLRDILPVFKIVALLAILSQAAAMLIFMAVHAIGRDAEKSSGLVSNLDGKHFIGLDVGRGVAAVARESGMLALQVVAGLTVVETGRRRRPFDDFEIFAVVLGVAARALLAGVGFEVVGGMQAAPGAYTGGDLGMAFQALQRARRTQSVASRAISCAV